MPVWILRHLPIIALVGVLGGGVWWITSTVRERDALRHQLDATSRKLGAAEAQLEQAAEAARIHRAHLARAAEEAREWEALSDGLQQMEGRDAPLSPLLSATADRLYRAGQ